MSALMRISQASARIQRQMPGLGAVGSRAFAGAGGFDDRERAAEKNWALEKDRELLLARAAKAKAMAEEAGHDHEVQGEAELKAILGTKAEPAVVEALLKWKSQR